MWIVAILMLLVWVLLTVPLFRLLHILLYKINYDKMRGEHSLWSDGFTGRILEWNWFGNIRIQSRRDFNNDAI